ncbi:MAG: response regulator [Spirochaetales bacterium]|uniref:Response regulator n=1 Tax=Candidatus Thalassospirochaeta sargassi TaxID=3119039 RepID=A0AAJ1MP50_9SPIO|nr:response regulator [Spirochaetales bacterium]
MYKLFLIEDEELIRTRIRENFDWELHGFQFSGEAPDGEIALSLIEEIKPDVVVTDIKMPFMDGLQLSRLLKKQMPWVKIIIISGFNDFEYAKEAISLGVTEYILKPVKPSELSETLDKVRTLLDDEKKKIADLEKHEQTVKDSLSVLKDRFLLETVMFGKTPAEIIEKAYAFEMDLRARFYAVIVVRFEGDGKDSGKEYLETLKIDALIKRLLSDSRNVLSCLNNVNETILIVLDDDKGEIETICQNLAEEITSQSKALISGTVTAGIGQTYDRLSDLKASYEGAVKALEYNFIFQGRDVVTEDDISHLSTVDSGLKGINAARLGEFLKFARVEGIDAFLDNYLIPLKKTDLSKGVFIRYTYLNTLLAAGRFIEDLSGNAEEILPEINEMGRDVTELYDFESLKSRLHVVLKTAIEFRSSRNFSKYQMQVGQAKEYINQNYSNPSLSLADAASVANFSECRFSTIFKQESGYKFTEYLTKVRLSKASELLKTTNKQTSEIALEVGYNDSHYFSYIFKKVNGITPTQFRDGIG